MRMKSKNAAGRGTNPINEATGVYGSSNANSTIARVVIVKATLGLLLKGLRAVRITKITRVCVARDSTNQPV
jgi:hypothetical protein